MQPKMLSGISFGFPKLSQSYRQVTHVLLTRPPLGPKASLDLHVLGTPPAFVLSQDQTLHKKFEQAHFAHDVHDVDVTTGRSELNRRSFLHRSVNCFCTSRVLILTLTCCLFSFQSSMSVALERLN